MTDLTDLTVRGQNAARERHGWRADLTVVAAAVAAVVVAWLLWVQAGGVDLTAKSGSSTQTVGLAASAVLSLVVALIGVGLLRLLEARTTNGLRSWTIVATTVLVLSALGPLGATTLAAGLGLASMHLLVGGILILGVRRVRRAR